MQILSLVDKIIHCIFMMRKKMKAIMTKMAKVLEKR